MHLKNMCFALILLLVLNSSSAVFGLTSNDVIAAGAVLLDQSTGQILFEKNGSQPMFPASTTKVLTALIILEDTPLTDVVTIDDKTPYSEGSRIYLIEGEQVTVEQLLYAMLLSSANDAAVALAKHHSGTVQAFSQVMNHRAKSLGATGSNFVNPNGLPDPNHVTSAKDLALIAAKAMENPTFRKMVSTVSYDLQPTNKQPEVRHLYNGNRLLHGTGWRNKIVINNQTLDIKWDLADGIKTGYTHVARQCLVASASQDGRRVIAVVLKSEGKDVYKDARIMLQHGLGDFHNVTLVKKDAPLGNLIFSDDKIRVPVKATTDLVHTLPSGTELTASEPKLIPQDNLVLPISPGQVVGKAEYTLPNQETLSVPVKAAEAVEDLSLSARAGRFFSWALKGAVLLLKVLALGISLFLIWRSAATWKRIQKRKRLQQLKSRAERDKPKQL